MLTEILLSETLTGLGTPSTTRIIKNKISCLTGLREPRGKAGLNNEVHLLQKANPSRLGVVAVPSNA